MNYIKLIPRLKEIYAEGQNVIQFLKNQRGAPSGNSIEDILISYDFQAGSYVSHAKQNPEFNSKYTSQIVDILKQLGEFSNIMEVGVGEATTLGNVLKKYPKKIYSYGFDISWSRIVTAKEYIKEIGEECNLFIADLFNMPFADSSIDVVYTSHSIEPNGGREIEALQELYRVAKKYLVLLEPTDEFASVEGKERMIKNGYVQNLASSIRQLGYNLIEYRPFGISVNPLNPTGLYVIEKAAKADVGQIPFFCCPISKTPLMEYLDHFYSKDILISFPKIMGIPCLWSNYGILTSKHE